MLIKLGMSKADKEDHQVIVETLNEISLLMLSERGSEITHVERKNWKQLWMADSLNGTKEFINRGGGFAVKIIQIEKGESVFGVVNYAAMDKLCSGGKEIGIFFIEKNQLAKKEKSSEVVEIVASRLHLYQETEGTTGQFDKVENVPMGSLLKFKVGAKVNADYYLRFAPTMECGTVAAHAIINAVGYQVIESNINKPLFYNKEISLNPIFY